MSAWEAQAYIKAANAESNDEYSRDALALSGDTLAVGARYEDGCGTSIVSGASGYDTDNGCFNAGAVYMYVREDGEWRAQAYIKAPNAGSNDEFGDAVALSGDTLVVGAPGEGGCGTSVVHGASDYDTADNPYYCQSSGAVYVYVREGGVWSAQAYIKAPNAGMGDHLGRRVALSGDTLAVSAPGEDGCSTSIVNGASGYDTADECSLAGAVYVFVREGGVWRAQSYIKAGNAEALDTIGNQWGGGLALSGDTLAVGAEWEDGCGTSIVHGASGFDTDNACTYAGAVYVYVREDGEWSAQAYIKAPNSGPGDRFGDAVALSGDTLAVGASYEAGCGTSIVHGASGYDTADECDLAGAVYVYVREAGVWSAQAYIKGANADQRDYFGFAVAFSGDMLAVGATGKDGCGTSIINGASGYDTDVIDPAREWDEGCVSNPPGAVYMYVREGGVWKAQALIKAANAGSSPDQFGQSLGFSGGTLAVGAHSEDGCGTSIVNGASGYDMENGCTKPSIKAGQGTALMDGSIKAGQGPGGGFGDGHGDAEGPKL